MRFINEAEQRVAEVLDQLRLVWLYEPTLFVFETNEHGHCTYGFMPDFYLPRQDLYIEVTEMKILTPKNGKMRRLRECYPDVRCELLTRQDVRGPGLKDRIRSFL